MHGYAFRATPHVLLAGLPVSENAGHLLKLVDRQ